MAGGLGKSLHGGISTLGLEFDSFVRVSLVDMYVKFEHLGIALQLFEESSERIKNDSILLLNVLISGCCKVGDLRRAMELAMPKRNSGSWNSLINVLMRIGDIDKGMDIFDQMPEWLLGQRWLMGFHRIETTKMLCQCFLEC